ncbi:PREDICTED: probable N-acetyltransferase HLS1 isoform X2 [Tarenaya hassleriana]|uniref:probable N-acetyltransferase HLS1 isoform X2 n=1 Tax=Tarenaya hassleriana TaxID=28532 RepID=UPI00053C5666|nr:PREDICTED: probable N-acetyltransferase HLS1 isoform X2 [Tarenaya hassleriana]
MVDNRIVIRGFDEERDGEMVGKLEGDCENQGSIHDKHHDDNEDGGHDHHHLHKRVSTFTNMMGKGDPLCRIRLYPLHLMLVAELQESREVVGVVKGCIKSVGTKHLGSENVKLGCIIGLRVSSNHRMGIGVRLVHSVEEWMARNKVDYTFLATEKTNVASRNLFTSKCNYTQLASLVIFIQEPSSVKQYSAIPKAIKIESLRVEEAISMYNIKLKEKDIYPTDIEAILKEKMNLGTWVSYFKDEKWVRAGEGETPSSWVMFSVWSSCQANNGEWLLPQVKFLSSVMEKAREKILPACLKVPRSVEKKRLGFLFLFGIHGEGERVEELVKSTWRFTMRLAETVKGCEVVLTEMGVSDPLVRFLEPQAIPGLSCIDDVWYIKRATCHGGCAGDEVTGELGNVFVDPRDF